MSTKTGPFGDRTPAQRMQIRKMHSASLLARDEVADATTHVTHIEREGDQWAWICTCGTEATGFELADVVIAAAIAHGPLAADSLIPVDDEEGD